MKDLKLCLNSFAETNEIQNDMLTLAECGVRGAPMDISTGITENTVLPPGEKPTVPTYVIFYDYKPCEIEDPVLLYFNC